MKVSFYKFALALVRFLLSFAYSVRVGGTEQIPKKGSGYLLCCNHISAVDPIFIAPYVNDPVHFMGKAELFQNKFLDKLFRAVGAFPVSREKGDVTAVNYAVKLVSENRILGIFPEGTRSKTGKMGRLKSGALFIAAQSGGDILPCVIKPVGKSLWRKKLVVRYGKLIKNEELGLSGKDRTALKNANRLLTETLEGLLEEIHG